MGWILFWSPYMRDQVILGPYWVALIFGNSHLRVPEFSVGKVSAGKVGAEQAVGFCFMKRAWRTSIGNPRPS